MTWEEVIGKADVLERPEQGFLWCKVPKAASTSLLYAYLQLAHVPSHQIPEVSHVASHVRSTGLYVYNPPEKRSG